MGIQRYSSIANLLANGKIVLGETSLKHRDWDYDTYMPMQLLAADNVPENPTLMNGVVTDPRMGTKYYMVVNVNDKDWYLPEEEQ